MKTIHLLVALFVSMSSSAQLGTAFGVKAGTNYAQFISDDFIVDFSFTPVEFQGKIGYYVGGFMNIGLSDKLSIRPELLFANQGTRTFYLYGRQRDTPREPEIELDVKTNVNEHTLLLPVVFRYGLTETFFLEAGAQIAYAFNRTEIFRLNEFDPSTEGEEAQISLFTSDYDKLDIGASLGVGVDLTEKLELNLRYVLGIVEREDEYRTSVINFGLGFTIL